MFQKGFQVISLVLSILLIFPLISTAFVPQSSRAQAAAVDRETAYKGLLITGVLITTFRLLRGSSSAEESQPGEAMDYNEDDLYWLAKAVHGEARGEPYEGQVAVAAVILSRVESDKFPDQVYDVIFQENQFTAVSDGQIYLEPNETAYEAAREAFKGRDPSQGALYFYNPDTARHLDWFATREKTVKIGQHVFAK